MRRHNSKTPEQHRQFAKALESGKNIKESLITAGYSEKQASKGRAAISGNLLQALTPSGRRLIVAARKMTWQDREDLIIGRLQENIENGSDKAALSAKIMGSHKSLALWQPENQTGVVVLNVASLPEKDGKVPENE